MGVKLKIYGSNLAQQARTVATNKQRELKQFERIRILNEYKGIVKDIQRISHNGGFILHAEIRYIDNIESLREDGFLVEGGPCLFTVSWK